MAEAAPQEAFDRIPVIVSFAEQVKMTETYGFAGSTGKTFLEGQRLVPKVNGGRALVNEIMGSNLRVRETINLGEGETRSFYDIVETNATFGWTTFDQSLGRSYADGSINAEVADLYATNKARMTRYIDDINKQRGLVEEKPLGLRLDLDPTITARSMEPRLTLKVTAT